MNRKMLALAERFTKLAKESEFPSEFSMKSVLNDKPSANQEFSFDSLINPPSSGEYEISGMGNSSESVRSIKTQVFEMRSLISDLDSATESGDTEMIQGILEDIAQHTANISAKINT